MIELTQEQWERVLALIPKLQQNKASAIVAGSYLTDEQALTATAIYPLFKAGIAVNIGERYRDANGDLYKVVQAHTPHRQTGNHQRLLPYSPRCLLMSGRCLYSPLGRMTRMKRGRR